MDGDQREELTERDKRKLEKEDAIKNTVIVAGRVISRVYGGEGAGKVVDKIVSTEEFDRVARKFSKTSAKYSYIPRTTVKKLNKNAPRANKALDMYSAMNGGKSSSNSTASTSTSNTSTNVTSNLGKGSKSNGLLNFFKNIGSSTEAKTEKTEDLSASGEIIEFAKKAFLGLIGGFSGFGGCMGLILIIAVIMLFLGPLMHINSIIEGIASFGDHLGNWVTGCGWTSDEECYNNRMDNFYVRVEDRSKFIKNSYNIDLNDELLIATLTYTNPFSDYEYDPKNPGADDFIKSTKVDFRRATNEIDKLINEMTTCNMVVEILNKTYTLEVPCINTNEDSWEDRIGMAINPLGEVIENAIQDAITNALNGSLYDITGKLDEEKYRKYLEEEFIEKYYSKHLPNDDTKQDKILLIVDEIYSRVAYFNYLFAIENNKVKEYANCPNGVSIDFNGEIKNYSLETYVAGLICPNGECKGDNEEALKALSVAYRTLVLNQTSNCSEAITSDSLSSDFDTKIPDNVLDATKATGDEILISGSAIYNDLTVEQDKFFELAKEGLNYKEILEKIYGEVVEVSGMVSSSGKYSVTPEGYGIMPKDKAELQERAKHYAEKKIDIINGQAINLMMYQDTAGLISQCPWYVKSRALELIYLSNMEDPIKLDAMDALISARGNGNSWYNGIPSLDPFNKSSDSTQPRVGAIISWSSSTKAGASHNYGHVAIVEAVNYTKGTITISEAYNGAGADAANNWANTVYRIQELSFDEIQTYGNKTGYSFNGYVYILG